MKKVQRDIKRKENKQNIDNRKIKPTIRKRLLKIYGKENYTRKIITQIYDKYEETGSKAFTVDTFVMLTSGRGFKNSNVL